MKEDYFVKNEQICKREGEQIMLIMDIKIDNLYAFKNFHMNMSYPKKIVDSTIPEEYLHDRPNFRYKKLNIIMGGNATGKTSLGKVLMLFVNYLSDGNYKRFTNKINDVKKETMLKIEFVTEYNQFCRFEMKILPSETGNYTEENVEIQIQAIPIEPKDNYENCVKKLDNGKGKTVSYDGLDLSSWNFSYPEDAGKTKTYIRIEEEKNYLYVLKHILQTLDPSIKEVVKMKEVENTYAVKWENCSAIIKDGQIVDGQVLSSGTKAGLDISYIITALVCDLHDLYYCDELFSFVNSDVEKVCLSIMIDRLTDKKQLFFTTHNTDILDMQLPKHSFYFLKKEVEDEDMPIKCINASQYLKRNTDSLKNAVENDLFCTAPELHKLYEIADL